MSISNDYTMEAKLNVSLFTFQYLYHLLTIYNKAFRFSWHRYQRKTHTKNQLIDELKEKFSLTYPFAESVYNDVVAKYKNLYRVTEIKLEILNTKYNNYLVEYDKLAKKINGMKHVITCGEYLMSQRYLQEYRNYKKRLHKYSEEINRLKLKCENLEKNLDTGILHISCGGKKEFMDQWKTNGLAECWKQFYVEKRDSRIVLYGNTKAYSGNFCLILRYDPNKDLFSGSISKLPTYNKSDTKYYYLGEFDFKHKGLRPVLINILKNQSNEQKRVPLYYHIRMDGRTCYLHVTFPLVIDKYETSTANGVIGLDYNYGFIALSETDKFGNMVLTKTIKLSVNQSTEKSDTILQTAIAEIVKYALKTKKSISIEDLNFNKKIAKLVKNKNKRYNKMITTFNYSKYMKFMKNSTHKNKVELIIVDSAYTSQNGKEKYADSMKLCIHNAASYVIARRGQNLPD